MRRVLSISLCLNAVLFANAEPITTGSLIREMLDLERLAEFPNPAYKTVQFSSYDRRSAVPGGKDWFANSDGFGKEPILKFEVVAKHDRVLSRYVDLAGRDLKTGDHTIALRANDGQKSVGIDFIGVQAE